MEIKIKPITRTIDTLSISNVSVKLNKSASVVVSLSGDINESKIVDLTSQEYDAWGSDDDYIYDLILSKLGLEKA